MVSHLRSQGADDDIQQLLLLMQTTWKTFLKTLLKPNCMLHGLKQRTKRNSYHTNFKYKEL